MIRMEHDPAHSCLHGPKQHFAGSQLYGRNHRVWVARPMAELQTRKRHYDQTDVEQAGYSDGIHALVPKVPDVA